MALPGDAALECAGPPFGIVLRCAHEGCGEHLSEVFGAPTAGGMTVYRCPKCNGGTHWRFTDFGPVAYRVAGSERKVKRGS